MIGNEIEDDFKRNRMKKGKKQKSKIDQEKRRRREEKKMNEKITVQLNF